MPSNTNFLLKSCPRRWIPCWLLTNTAVTSAVTNFWCHKLTAKVNDQNNSNMKNFICNQYGKRHPFLSTENIKICGRITKLEAIKCNLFAFSSISTEYLQKFEFLISQGIVATCLRWGGRCYVSFVANFIRFTAVQNFENGLRFDKVTESLKVGTFLRHSVYNCTPANGLRKIV